MHYLQRISLLSIVLLCLVSCSSITSPEYTLYLIRHAEKTTEQNPGLTKCGLKRANYLAEMLEDKKIANIYSTNYRRTELTAAPLASALSLNVQKYEPRDLEAFAISLKQQNENALVVGHSNTTPKLAAIISNQSLKKLPESEFDQIFILKIKGEEVMLAQKNQGFNCAQF